MTEPQLIAQGVRNELGQLMRQFSGHQDPARLLNDLARWKRRALTTLSPVVAPDDLSRFEDLSLRPNWDMLGGEDPLSPIIRAHEVYLDSLIAEMTAHPEFFNRGQVKKQLDARDALLSKVVGAPPELPAKITLHWLFKNVPVKFWLMMASALLAAFLFGVRVGSLPGVIQVVGPLLGVHNDSTPAMPARHAPTTQPD
jgi:hypothetical protein